MADYSVSIGREPICTPNYDVLQKAPESVTAITVIVVIIFLVRSCTTLVGAIRD
jgi:hypothetical protein